MGGCRRCTVDLLHCHGTLVLHSQGEQECTAPGCSGGPDLHDLVIDCTELAGCQCTRQAARDVA